MKAVIMAGGEGTRLRPLTCSIPKPMARLCSRPILEYIMDLLIKNNFDEATLTLKYLPNAIKDYFEDNRYKSLKLNFIEETESLGTAGSVKNAAKDFTEPFLVISGDCLCDFNLNNLMNYHNSTNALVTIALSKVKDPREYGLVKIESNNDIKGFLEKPGWEQINSDLANTGIYVINPESLRFVPDNQNYDFAKDMFPKMLQSNTPIKGYPMPGYWCDIGDLKAYLSCQQDIINGKVNCDISKVSEDVFSKSSLPKGDYKIIPPVYIGENVEIGNNSVIGPNSIIDDGCLIGENAKIRYSLMLPNSYVSDMSSMTSAILGEGASLKRNSAMYEGSATGECAVIGKEACVRPNVLIWPGKSVSDFAIASDNIKFGKLKREIFDDDGIKGESGIELTPEVCARLGAAIGSTQAGKKTGIAYDGKKNSKILKLALSAGLMSAGSHVWDFGECFEAQISFFNSFCGLGMGIYISDGEDLNIKICGEGGLPLPRFLERDIELKLSKGEFNRLSKNNAGRDIADMSSIQMMYQQELCRQARYGLIGQRARVDCKNERIVSILKESFERLGCDVSDDLILMLNESGTNLCIIDKKLGTISSEKLLAICCLNELQNGKDIALPFNAPQLLDVLAVTYGRKVLRYLRSPADNSDSDARKLSIKQAWVRDGLFMAVRILSIMNERNASISELLAEVPDFYIAHKTFPIGISPSELSYVLEDDSSEVVSSKEGITIKREQGRLLITPSRTGDKLKVLAEANNMEAAKELCIEIEKMLSK